VVAAAAPAAQAEHHRGATYGEHNGIAGVCRQLIDGASGSGSRRSLPWRKLAQRQRNVSNTWRRLCYRLRDSGGAWHQVAAWRNNGASQRQQPPGGGESATGVKTGFSAYLASVISAAVTIQRPFMPSWQRFSFGGNLRQYRNAMLARHGWRQWRSSISGARPAAGMKIIMNIICSSV
jgi:hypothetical protein